MFCLMALIVFSVLGIFSATHRQLAKEAFDCVFKRITLRPCTTGFDQRIKGKVIGKILNRAPKLAKGVNRFWEPLSWLLVIIFFVSLFFSSQAVYNLIKYKTCNPQDPQSCIFTAKPEEACECGQEKTTCQKKSAAVKDDNCQTGTCDNCADCEQQD